MRHTLPMYSLDNLFAPADWNDFVARLQRLMPAVPPAAMDHPFYTLSQDMGAIMTFGPSLGRETPFGPTCL